MGEQSDVTVPAGRKPAWLRVKAPQAPQFRATQALLNELRLHTVCEEARCPNKGECFSSGTATFLIMGDSCTRGCRFCSVGHGVVGPLDEDEPRRVAVAARRLELRHVVVTSVTRDDLADGGAAHYAATIAALRAEVPSATVEVLIPDLGGDEAALRAVLAARPDVLNHNLETAPRLYARVRPQASYERSLLLLERAVAWAHVPHVAGAGRRPLVKTGIMVGLGETAVEVGDVLADCAAVGVDVVTIGQYLQSQPELLPVVRYVSPSEFAVWEQQGAELGLRVQAGPFVRSSYRAGDLL
ncbi:MAG: lipoyl synthase [Thermoleophilia bacterium]